MACRKLAVRSADKLAGDKLRQFTGTNSQRMRLQTRRPGRSSLSNPFDLDRSSVERAIEMQQSARMGCSLPGATTVAPSAALLRGFQAAQGVAPKVPPQLVHRRNISISLTSGGAGLMPAVRLWRGAARFALQEGKALPRSKRDMGVWQKVRTFPKRKPFLTSILCAVSSYSLADYCIQRMESDEVDKKRVVCFGCIGLVNGLISWPLYVSLFAKLAPASLRFSNLSMAGKLKDKAGQLDVVKQVLLDNCLATPFVFLPVFYSFKTAMDSGSADIATAMTKLKTNCVEDNLASCKIWILGDIVAFSVPAYLRMPVLQAFNFTYIMALSKSRGSTQTS